MLIPQPLSREKDKPLYLGYWVPLAKTLPISGFLWKSSRDCMLPKITPLSRENGKYTYGPLMHSREGGGGRFGQTCMKKKQSERLMFNNEPSLCLVVSAPGRTLYVQAVILRNLILTLKLHIDLARLCVGITAHIWCQMKEDELNFVTIKTI